MNRIGRLLWIIPVLLWGGCTLGPTELALVLAIAVLLFGASRLPALGKAMGETLRSFKKAVSEDEAEERVLNERRSTKQLEQAQVDTSRTEERAADEQDNLHLPQDERSRRQR